MQQGDKGGDAGTAIMTAATSDGMSAKGVGRGSVKLVTAQTQKPWEGSGESTMMPLLYTRACG